MLRGGTNKHCSSDLIGYLHVNFILKIPARKYEFFLTQKSPVTKSSCPMEKWSRYMADKKVVQDGVIVIFLQDEEK